MTTNTNEFAPAWAVIEGVKAQCSKTFTCEEIEVNARGQFIAKAYAAYNDPRTLGPKFTAAGARLVEISGGQGNWWEFKFWVLSK
jgi:hypothetical protein